MPLTLLYAHGCMCNGLFVIVSNQQFFYEWLFTSLMAQFVYAQQCTNQVEPLSSGFMVMFHVSVFAVSEVFLCHKCEPFIWSRHAQFCWEKYVKSYSSLLLLHVQEGIYGIKLNASLLSGINIKNHLKWVKHVKQDKFWYL